MEGLAFILCVITAVALLAAALAIDGLAAINAEPEPEKGIFH